MTALQIYFFFTVNILFIIPPLPTSLAAKLFVTLSEKKWPSLAALLAHIHPPSLLLHTAQHFLYSHPSLTLMTLSSSSPAGPPPVHYTLSPHISCRPFLPHWSLNIENNKLVSVRSFLSKVLCAVVSQAPSTFSVSYIGKLRSTIIIKQQLVYLCMALLTLNTICCEKSCTFNAHFNHRLITLVSAYINLLLLKYFWGLWIPLLWRKKYTSQTLWP